VSPDPKNTFDFLLY